jgi:acyl dehydratase
MGIVYEKIMAMQVAPVEQTYEPKDCMLYALGVGFGHDPMNEEELAFVYEKNLKVMPTMATVLGYGGSWAREAGIDQVKVVNGEQGFTLHRPLQTGGTLIGHTHILEVCDTIPARAPDFTCDLPTRPEAALIYRLSGDYNPLHAEPAFARAAGFERPILHGLGTFGVSGHALLKTLCGYDPNRLISFGCRFSAPVFPGETIRTQMWRDGAVVSFRARVVERDVVAITNGRAEVR